jgi:hypothetical protein
MVKFINFNEIEFMTVVVDKKLTKKEVDALLKKMKPKHMVLDAKKFAGKLKIKGDPLEIQRQMRDE